MSDRRNRIRNRRSKRSSPWLIAIQLVIMAGVLIFIFVFRDFLSLSASNIFSAFDNRDLKVTADAGATPDTDRSRPSPRQTPQLKVIDAPNDAGGDDAANAGLDSGSQDINRSNPETSR